MRSSRGALRAARTLFVPTLTALSLAVALGACSNSELGDPHPTDRLDFPVSVTADPSGDLVWVVSGNFDLAWRGAAVLAIDVTTNQFVPELSFEVGNFPGPLTLYSKNGRAVAGYIASRDDDNLYTVSFGGDDPARPTVSCADAPARGDGILECPASGAIEKTTVNVDGTPTDLTVGDDPYSSIVRPASMGGEPDLLLVGGMANGILATLALSAAGTPRLVGNSSLANGLYGLASDPANGRIYAASKLSSTFTVIDVKPQPWSKDPDVLDPTNPFLTLVATVAVPTSSLVNDRARALVLSKDGTRLYATYRAPDALVTFDVTDDVTGGPRIRVLNKLSLAGAPGDIELVTGPDGDDILYVSCFRGDRIEVIDPRAEAVLGSIKVGQGPSDLAYVDRPDLGIKRLYVALFNDNAVGVIDLDPASPTYHTEIGEIR